MNRRLLIVDDEEGFREALRALLESAGFEVRECGGGEEALRFLESEEVDAVLSDVKMTSMDGVTLLHRVRELPGLHDLPFIFLTAHPELAESFGDELGADAVLGKPFRGEELFRALDAAIARRESSDREAGERNARISVAQ